MALHRCAFPADPIWMVRRPSCVGLLMLPFVVMLLAACTTAEPATSGHVRVLGAWSGEELVAFQAVVAPFEERTEVSIEYESTRDLRGTLDESLETARPPDLAGLEG